MRLGEHADMNDKRTFANVITGVCNAELPTWQEKRDSLLELVDDLGIRGEFTEVVAWFGGEVAEGEGS